MSLFKIKAIFIASALFLLCGCSGWHLRQPPKLPKTMEQIRITPNTPYSKLQREIRSRLSTAKVSIVSNSYNQKTTTLDILEDSSETKDQTIGIDGAVKELAITYKLRFRLTAANGGVLIPATMIKIRRNQPFNQQQILSEQVDKESLIQQLREEAVDRLLRRLYLAPEQAQAAQVAPKASPYSLNPLSKKDENSP